ncbi:molecular chaperone [Deinococcus multiflagellatus]|uniref:Molecular chaperone n=1 Tax=Deinococcus multiflagellatus TaxID=1656887 RepID=A0ABW1ZN12_9DEIO|nr:molecular chaperone [Deinococcus multiflagellatus]MBZ9715759.1 molecular chaperone [Deinococcus multiflagellatus]
MPTSLPHRPRAAHLWLRAALLSAAALSLGGAAGAQSFGFSPTTLQMDATKNLVAETTMINSTAAPARFTVVPRVWKVEGGQLVLLDTRDLIVNPASFTVKPGGSQVIRVGLRKKPGDTELSYRLLVQQEAIEGVDLPKVSADLSKDAKAGLNLTMTFSLPIYVTQPGATPKVQFTAQDSGQNVVLTVQNAGQRRAIYRNVTLSRGGASLGMQAISALAGSSQTLTLVGLGNKSGPLTIRYTGEDGQTLVQTVALP